MSWGIIQAEISGSLNNVGYSHMGHRRPSRIKYNLQIHDYNDTAGLENRKYAIHNQLTPASKDSGYIQSPLVCSQRAHKCLVNV